MNGSKAEGNRQQFEGSNAVQSAQSQARPLPPGGTQLTRNTTGTKALPRHVTDSAGQGKPSPEAKSTSTRAPVLFSSKQKLPRT